MTEQEFEKYYRDYDKYWNYDKSKIGKIKYIGEKISEIIVGSITVVLTLMFVVFVISIVLGFITLCLGAL